MLDKNALRRGDAFWGKDGKGKARLDPCICICIMELRQVRSLRGFRMAFWLGWDDT